MYGNGKVNDGLLIGLHVEIASASVQSSLRVVRIEFEHFIEVDQSILPISEKTERKRKRQCGNSKIDISTWFYLF
jgi:hypothetical protein